MTDLEELKHAVAGLKRALADALTRIQALEAHQTPFVGGNPSDNHGTKTDGTTKDTEANDVIATPPTFTSTSDTTR